jgi:2-iminobutanoate/2-iminopropanoate deaminase
LGGRLKSFALAVAVLTVAGCDGSRPSSQPAPPSSPSVQYIPRADNGPQRPFAEAVRVGNMLYLSGQLGDSAGKIVPGGIEAETRRTLENIKAALERNGSSMDNVVKCTAMLADMSEWPAMNAIYATYFTKHFPARSAFGASGLALGARMELECMATVDIPL